MSEFKKKKEETQSQNGNITFCFGTTAYNDPTGFVSISISSLYQVVKQPSLIQGGADQIKGHITALDREIMIPIHTISQIIEDSFILDSVKDKVFYDAVIDHQPAAAKGAIERALELRPVTMTTIIASSGSIRCFELPDVETYKHTDSNVSKRMP